MKFDYYQNLMGSIKELWKHQNIFWAYLVLTIVYLGIYTMTQGIALAGMATTTMSEEIIPYAGLTMGLTWFIIALSLLYSVFAVAGAYGSFNLIRKKKKIEFGDFFHQGKVLFKKYFVGTMLVLLIMLPAIILYIAVLILFDYLGLGYEVSVPIMILLIIILAFFAIWISLRLVFFMPALATSEGVVDAFKESFNYKNKSHRNKTFGTTILASIAAGIIAQIIIIIGVILMLTIVGAIIGIPLIIATYFGAFFVNLALQLFIAKAYHVKGA
jgi:hypothetical protein